MGGTAASAARAYRTGNGTLTQGGIELTQHNRAHNGAGNREIGRVSLYGGQLKGASAATAAEYGLMSVDVGGYRTWTQWFSRVNNFDVYRYFDTGPVGHNSQFLFLFSVGTESRIYGAVQARANLSTHASFGIWGSAIAWSYARGSTYASSVVLGLGNRLESTEVYANLRTQLNAHISSLVSATAVHRSEPTHVELVLSWLVAWSTVDRWYPVRSFGPGITESWFSF